MPILTPKKPDTRKVPARRLPAEETPWRNRLIRSGYFLGALLFHLILLLILVNYVVFRAPAPVSNDFTKTYVPASPPPAPPPQTSPPTMPVPTQAVPAVASAASSGAPAPSFNIPMPDMLPTVALNQKGASMTAPTPQGTNNLQGRLSAIGATEGKWGRSASNIREADGDPHQVVATFPVYLASYANGDWDCNVHLTDGAIDAGSLPNLVAKLNEWSHGQITGKMIPTPLAIGGPDLLEKMPPFIFFTGHKDFVLTGQEIQNLQSYLQNGGAIWGDNALAGHGSRFDIAFHREMKRVIPDVDKNFEEVPMTHGVFTQSWYKFDAVPTGMNYYAEPLQHIDIDGKIAVIYTPNDYSDLFFMRIAPGDEKDLRFPVPGSPLYSRGLFEHHKTVFFRNFELDSCLNAQHLGMNIICYLLVRFDKELQAEP